MEINTRWKDSRRHELVNVMRQPGEMVESTARIVTDIVHQIAPYGFGSGEHLIGGLTEVVEWVVGIRVETGGDADKLAKGILRGILRTGKITETVWPQVAEAIARPYFHDILASGAPLSKTARAFVQGALDGAAENGWHLEETAAVTATAVFEAAAAEDRHAGERVREALQGQEINLVRIQVREPPERSAA